MLTSLLLVHPGASAQEIGRSNGQDVYVPVYSHFTALSRNELGWSLTTTVAIRNTDRQSSIRVQSVTYFGSEGEELEQFLDAPRELAPLASMAFVVPERDKEGGIGANFIVTWKADKSVNEPIIEAISFGGVGSRGFGFRSPGRVIAEH